MKPNLSSNPLKNRFAPSFRPVNRFLWKLTVLLRGVYRAVFSSQTGTADANRRSGDVARQDDTPLASALLSVIEQQALRFSVSPAIHPADHIFKFIMGHPRFESDEARVRYYFEDGANSATQFAELLHKFCGQTRRIPRVLEFASGYGCVTRHLVRNKDFTLESCDIHAAAIDFLQTKIGVRAVGSSSFPENLSLPHEFDFVFALSFFSHMPITTWTRWLVRLTQYVRSGGVLAFTTHGMTSKPLLGDPEIPANGFWFTAVSEQSDLSTEEYGSTIVTEDFVSKNVLSISSVELLDTRTAYWWGHQDLYVLRKTP